MASELANILAGLNDDSKRINEFDFRVGVIEQFVQETGENTVSMRGSLLSNVPMLNIGDTVNLSTGDNVILLKYQTNYFIVGRVVNSGVDSFQTTAIDFQFDHVAVDSYAINTVEQLLATITFTYPSWANRAIVNANVNATGRNNSGATDFMFATVGVVGFSGNQQFAQAPNNGYATVTSNITFVTGILGSGPSFQIGGYSVTGSGTWTASTANQMDLGATAIYFRAFD